MRYLPFFVCIGNLFSQIAAIVLRTAPTPNTTDLTLSHDVVRDVNSKCRQICGKHDADSKCITGCEAEMYRCHNHNITVPEGQKKYDNCESRVLNKYQYQFALAHLLGSKSRNVTHLSKAEQDRCKNACSADWKTESKCLTSCEAALYRCHNYNVTVPEEKQLFEDCEKRVLHEHENSAHTQLTAHKALNISSSHTVARSRGFDAAALQGIRDSCHSSCGHNPSSSCLTGCEVEMYQCRDHNSTQPEGKKARDACEDAALEKWRAFAQGMDFAGHLTANVTSTASFSHLRSSCLGVCAVNVSQGCQTGCEVELYQCMDRRVFLPGCEEKVLGKYRAMGTLHDGDPPHYGVRLEQLKQACQHACGGKMDSSCQTRCEVDMYQCMDHNYTVPEGKHEYDHCVDDTLEKYREESDVGAHLLSKKSAASQMVFDAVACNGVCGKDQFCTQSCRVDMYHCDTTSASRRHRAGGQDACKTRTAATYKKLAMQRQAR